MYKVTRGQNLNSSETLEEWLNEMSLKGYILVSMLDGGTGVFLNQEKFISKVLTDIASKTKVKNKSNWHCQDCGSVDVEEGTWINVNTGESLSPDTTGYYCNGCQSQPEKLVKVNKLTAIL